MIIIQGFTEAQQGWANWMWQDIDYELIAAACEQHVDARIARDMILAAELDQVVEVTDEVQSYLSSIS